MLIVDLDMYEETNVSYTINIRSNPPPSPILCEKGS